MHLENYPQITLSGKSIKLPHFIAKRTNGKQIGQCSVFCFGVFSRFCTNTTLNKLDTGPKLGQCNFKITRLAKVWVLLKKFSDIHIFICTHKHTHTYNDMLCMFAAERTTSVKINSWLFVCSIVYRCIVGWKLTRAVSKRLTGAGPRSQRGLESPGAEVGRCSLKDEGDRQGDKHGPLSTWGSSIFVLFLILLSLLFCSWSVVSFFGLFSSAFLPVRGRPCGERRRML